MIADHVLVEPAWLRDITGRLYELPAYLIGVRCPLDVLENREKLRKNRTLGQARLQYHLVHIPGIYDLEVDTSRFTPEECAAQIKSRINWVNLPRFPANQRAVAEVIAVMFGCY